MRVEFSRADAPDDVVAVARWVAWNVELEVRDDSVAQALRRVFRPTPVVVDDAAYRRQGTRGEVLLEPGSLEWFRAAALARAPEAGLSARFVPGVDEGGWDPAAQYRTFSESIDRMARRSD